MLDNFFKRYYRTNCLILFLSRFLLSYTIHVTIFIQSIYMEYTFQLYNTRSKISTKEHGHTHIQKILLKNIHQSKNSTLNYLMLIIEYELLDEINSKTERSLAFYQSFN